MSSPVELVNNLQKLVVSAYSGGVTDPFELYKTKHSISDLCLALLRSVQGPEEYTAILAGRVAETSTCILTGIDLRFHSFRIVSGVFGSERHCLFGCSGSHCRIPKWSIEPEGA